MLSLNWNFVCQAHDLHWCECKSFKQPQNINENHFNSCFNSLEPFWGKLEQVHNICQVIVMSDLWCNGFKFSAKCEQQKFLSFLICNSVDFAKIYCKILNDIFHFLYSYCCKESVLPLICHNIPCLHGITFMQWLANVRLNLKYDFIPHKYR